MAQRYLMTFLAVLCNILNLSGRDTLRIAILGMKGESEDCLKEIRSNSSEHSVIWNNASCGSISWTDGNVATLLGAFNYGIFFSEALSGPMVDCFGAKWILLIVTIVSGLTNLATPVLASSNLPALLTSQILYGLSGGLVVPSLHSLIARWEPSCETGRLSGIIYSGSPISAVITAVFTGYMTKYSSWQVVFYTFGAIAFIWSLPWLLWVQDDPMNHPHISNKEKILLQTQTKVSSHRPRIKEIPLRKILSSKSVWSIILANMGFSWASVHTANLLPLYCHDVLQMEIHTNGMTNSLPYVGAVIVSFISSLAITRVTRSQSVSVSVARKIATSISLWGFAAFTIAVPFIGKDVITVTAFTTIAYSLSGAHIVGAWCSPLDIAPNYAATVMGISGFFSYMVGALVPHVKTLVMSYNLGWRPVFIIAAAVAFLSNLVFLVFGSDQEEEWNAVEKMSTDYIDNNVEKQTPEEWSAVEKHSTDCNDNNIGKQLHSIDLNQEEWNVIDKHATDHNDNSIQKHSIDPNQV